MPTGRTINRCIELRQFPQGVPQETDFQPGERPMPVPGEGQFLARNIYLSLDPFLRGVISGRHMYAERVGPGDVMPGNTLARIIESRHPDYRAGEYVRLSGGWQEYVVSDGTAVWRAHPEAPLSTAIGVLGMPGLTAYAGLIHTAEPKAGDTVVVSAAAGPVGSTVGQIAKILGCRAIGIAGSDEKCRLVVEHFGFDACINYKTADLREALQVHCPDGINVYFDNVGGETLEAVLGKLALGARVTLCGLITQYNADKPPAGPNLGPVIGARAILKGFVVYDHYGRWDEFQRDVGSWLASGQIRILEDRADGLQAAPRQFCRLMRGENVGKSLVVIAPETLEDDPA